LAKQTGDDSPSPLLKRRDFPEGLSLFEPPFLVYSGGFSLSSSGGEGWGEEAIFLSSISEFARRLDDF
jgi:hypothetical protein